MWRSLLFVPVLEDRFVGKAADRGADAVILDLEASIAEDRKAEARRALAAAVTTLSSKIDVTVRINPLWLEALRDLEASVIQGVSALHLACCESADEIVAIDRVVSELEIERGLVPGGIRLIAMLESPAAVLRAESIARASQRTMALTLGVEDYATGMGVAATGDVLRPAAVQVIQAARASGLEPLVVPASMAAFRDVSALEAAADFARRSGSSGGYAVHPAQIEVLNRVFQPTKDELRWANDVLNAAEGAARDGNGVFLVGGQMIDLPLITRARHIAARGALLDTSA